MLKNRLYAGFLYLPPIELLKNIAAGALLLIISSAFLWESVVDEALQAIILARTGNKNPPCCQDGFCVVGPE
nr:hypothetical protein [Comamonas jiangduensis]